MTPQDVQNEVRQFYDKVGWQKQAEGFYQNAQYEDLRPVSSEYIHRCHMRVKRHLAPSGDYLLDAGSGPVQYDEYLSYSENYDFRVCMDLSHVALKDAQKRLGDKGLCVVADITQLPFKAEAFDGIVSLHTIHHVPIEAKVGVYLGLFRLLKPGKNMATVDGWSYVPLNKVMNLFIKIATRLKKKVYVGKTEYINGSDTLNEASIASLSKGNTAPAGTFVLKTSATWLKKELDGKLPLKIFVWRSVSVKFLRAVIHPEFAGKFWLKVLYRLEEWFPRFFGENGQYPIIVIEKPLRQA